MKKFIFMFIAFVAMSFGSAYAQHTTKNYLTDNVFVNAKVGGITPLNHTFDWANHGFANERLNLGLEVGKWVTPEFGFSFAGETNVNTEGVHTVFDASNVTANVLVNISNLVLGYNGEPRDFEVVAKPGIGWAHIYGHNGPNALTYNTAVNFGWNLGADKAWKLGLEPAIAWSTLNAAHTRQSVAFDSRRASFALNLVLGYTLGGHNGKHHFTNCDKVYTEDEYAAIVAKWNEADTRANTLRGELERCNKEKVELEKLMASDTATVETEVFDTLGYFIFFDKGKALVTKEMRSQVKVLADYLKLTPNVSYEVVGYADSATGSAKFNQKLSEERAKNVVEMLKGYGVNGANLKAVGKGDTEQPFDTVEGNRVVITVCK